MNKDNVRSFGIFAVVIIALAGLTIGGVYFAKNRSQAYEPQTQYEDSNNLDVSEEESSVENEDGLKNFAGEELAVDNSFDESETQIESESIVDESKNIASSEEENVSVIVATTGQVPETGLGDVLLSIFMLMIIVFLSVHIVRSKILLIQRLLS